MSGGQNAPVIIKRKKIVGGDGHHGGAWKVAYADFVTAMMAFFMLMWLLNATTEKQRKGIADYFTPTIAVNRVSGGGAGALSGDSIFTEETLAHVGVGSTSHEQGAPRPSETADGAQEQMLRDLSAKLNGTGGESLAQENELRHVISRISDEGLVVEIFSLPGAPLFSPEDDSPTQLLVRLLDIVGRVFSETENDIAVEGHSRAHALVLAQNPAWDHSLERAAGARALLRPHLHHGRLARVTGHSDRRPALPDAPMAIRNDRLEIILLRQDAQ